MQHEHLVPTRITNIENVEPGIEGLYGMGAAVIDLIPPQERRLHRYMRGASLGAIAYNLMNHDMLNTTHGATEPSMHFAAGARAYDYADRVARSIAQSEGYRDLQFPAPMRLELGGPSRLNVPMPGIIFALDPDYNKYLLRDSDMGAGEGVVWDGIVTLDMIDRYSRAAMEQLVSVLAS